MTYAPGGRTGSWQPWVAMGAAKAALEVLCRYFAVALAPRQITVNAISPGWTEDSVLNALPEAVQNTIRSWHQSGCTPMRKLGVPADLGNAVALLCSAEASWITGQTLDVDGGTSLMEAARPLQEAPGPPSGAAFENKTMRLLGPNFHFHSSILGFSLSLPLPNYCPANHLEIPKIPLTLF